MHGTDDGPMHDTGGGPNRGTDEGPMHETDEGAAPEGRDPAAPPGRGQDSGKGAGLVRFALSILVSALLVWLLLRQVDARRLLEVVRGIHRPSLLLFAATSLAMLAARVVRYRILLRERVAWTPLTLITMVRGMLADLLPARLGSLSYVYLVHRAGVPLDDAFSSFFLAFILDLVAMAPLILGALLVVGGAVTGAWALAALALVLLAISVAALGFLAPGLRLGVAVLRWITGLSLPAKLREWIRRLEATGASTALRIEEARSVLLPALMVSFAVRFTKFGAYYFLLQAVLVGLGMPWGAMGFVETFLGVAGAELSATLPVSGIGALGTYEAAWTIGFTRLGMTTEQAVLSGFGTHILSQIFDYSLGVGALLVLMWPRGGQESRNQEEEA